LIHLGKLAPPARTLTGQQRAEPWPLFWGVVIAKIAFARRIRHGSSSGSLGRHAGSLANAGIPDERIGGLLI
jgi:hypothetical protein